MLAAMTRPGAAPIITVVAVGDYLTTHIPEEGPAGESGTVDTLTRGRRGPMACYGCQELGHIIDNCPHWAAGPSTPGATLAYN